MLLLSLFLTSVETTFCGPKRWSQISQHRWHEWFSTRMTSFTHPNPNVCLKTCIHTVHEYIYLPDSNLNAILLEPYCRIWSICHFTTSLGNSSSVNMAMWNKLRSKSLSISKRQGPLKARDLALRSLTRNVSSSGIAGIYVHNYVLHAHYGSSNTKPLNADHLQVASWNGRSECNTVELLNELKVSWLEEMSWFQGCIPGYLRRQENPIIVLVLC